MVFVVYNLCVCFLLDRITASRTFRYCVGSIFSCHIISQVSKLVCGNYMSSTSFMLLLSRI